MGSDDVDDGDELLSYGSPPKRPTRLANTEGSKHDAAALLDFYRQRCDAFQSERRVMLEQMANVEVSKEELHRAKWELKTRKQELLDRDEALKQAHTTIFQLREEKLKLETENAALRIKEQEDRRKIQHLLALTQPVMEEVTFARDSRPDTVASYPPPLGSMTYPYPSTMHVGSEEMLASERSRLTQRPVAMKKRAVSATARHSQTATSRTAALGSRSSTAGANQILRTIYMPNDQAETMANVTANLQEQLHKQQQLHHERVQHLLDQFAEEKTKLEQEVRQFETTNELLEKQLTKSQRLLQKTTKDYLILRYQSQEKERAAQEELLVMTEQCQELVQEKVIATKEAMAEADATKEKAQEETAQYTEQLRGQTLARERDLHILREQYTALQEACTRRIQDLQTRLTKLRTRYRDLDRRRTMEMEGFTRDIANVKRHMQRLEAALYGRRVFVRQQRDSSTATQTGTRPRNEVLGSADLNDEIALLQQRMAELAADVDAS